MIWGYLSLFAVSFLAATVLPLGSEAALAALIAAQGALAGPLAVATAGNVLGSATTFWLGRKAAAVAETRSKPAPPSRSVRTATAWIQRWGAPILILAWVPLIGDGLVAVAGALRLPAAPCMLWIALGKAGRYLAIGWAILAAIN